MQNLYHGFPPYFGVSFLPIIVLIGAAEKRMMLHKFDERNKRLNEGNKKLNDMFKEEKY